MKPSDLLLSLMPSAQSILELARWLDAEGATDNLSLYMAFDLGARGMADSIIDAIHSEEATGILVERLRTLRPFRAAEIRRDMTFTAIKQARGAEAEALVEQTPVRVDNLMKPLFYVMLHGIDGPALFAHMHEQDALRMAEAVLGCIAPYGPAPGSIEVGELVPTAGVVPNPGRYVDGIEFPYSIQCIEGDPAPDELVHAREVAARRDVKLRALRQGLRDLLAALGDNSCMDNATIAKRLMALLED